MKRVTSAVLSLLLIGLFVSALMGCGAEIKAENDRLKAENTSLKSDNDKLKLEIQKLKEDIQKAAEKDTTISDLKTENEALKKQVADLPAQMAKKKKRYPHDDEIKKKGRLCRESFPFLLYFFCL